MVSKETLIEDLQQVRDKLGRQIKQADLREHGDWSVRTFQKEFGSWNDALMAAGLELNQRSTISTTDKDFIEDLRRVAEIVGRTPRRGDVDEHGKWATDTYRRNMLGDGLSKWNDILREGGFELYYEKDSSEAIEYTCEVCGDTFELRDYRDPRRFCGTECHGEHRRGKYTGEDSWTYNSKEVDCEWCGDTLVRPEYRLESFENHFCDQQCQGEWLSVHNRGASHPNYSGGEIVYGQGWNEDKKEAVRKRDGYECQVCGKSQKEELKQNNRKLSVHHIINARKFDDPECRNDIDNLVALCHKHHMKWEGIPLRPQRA